tara:strand:- start:162 stop:1976 length:1815 start_codon:yes stop_codon:yes gene_type:complete
MIEENSSTVEDIYQGGYSSLDSDSGDLFTGVRTDTGSIGISTDPRTANILKEMSDKIAPGQKVVELSLIQPEILDAIPKQHLEEINKLGKLTGVDVTVHGPLIDASGVTQQGFEEQQREIAERKILHALERSHEINPDGNIPVTFHTANQLPGVRYSKKEGEEETVEFMPIVNQETGQIAAVKTEERYLPYSQDGKIKKKEYDIKKALELRNDTEWSDSLDKVEFNRENAERIMKEVHPAFVTRFIEHNLERMNPKSTSNPEPLNAEEMEQFKKISSAEVYLNEAERTANALFDKAYKYGSDQEKRALKKVAEEFGKITGRMEKEPNPLKVYNPRVKSDALFQLRDALEGITPELYKSAEEYALKKSNETFGNAAWQSYNKFGKNAPIISIENPPAGMGLSRGADVRDMVKGAQKQFVKNAVDSGKLSEEQAKEQAEKLIGVTWDVGHINQLRQFGFSGEDIIKEAEKIKPLVKHIHLSDNFGMENTELPMGMGNVDLKEVMEKLGKKGEDAKKIVEAAHWWQHQQTSPVGATFEALGSPIYSMGMAPYWNQAAGMQAGYFGGYGEMLPPINYESFGAGFSNLPVELGGQRGGGRSRMGGTPME